jgi:hypothetical protein
VGALLRSFQGAANGKALLRELVVGSLSTCTIGGFNGVEQTVGIAEEVGVCTSARFRPGFVSGNYIGGID